MKTLDHLKFDSAPKALKGLSRASMSLCMIRISIWLRSMTKKFRANLIFIEDLKHILQDCNDDASLEPSIGHIAAFVGPHDGWPRSVNYAQSSGKGVLTPNKCRGWQRSCDSLLTIALRGVGAA